MSIPAYEPESEDDDVHALRREARELRDGYRRFLANPAYVHNIDLAVLSKIAADDAAPVRERRQAAEVLLRYRLAAMEALATLAGAREQSLERLGLKPNPLSLAMTQINQTIEIVRTDDWRHAVLVDAQVEALPEGEESKEDNARIEEAVGEDGDGRAGVDHG